MKDPSRSRVLVLYALGVVIAFCLALLVGMLVASPAHAATFTVNSTNDTGDGTCDASECTLREAITAANTNGESDTIEFASGVSGEIELSNAPSQGQFVIQNDSAAEDLTINGPGAEVLAIDGNGQTRGFAIQSGANATIRALTVKNGNYAAENGGGILNAGTLTVTDSTISGNSATASDRCQEASITYGVGIATSSGSTLTVTKSTISGNSAFTSDYSEGGGTATFGGGIRTVGNTIVAGNSADFEPDAAGTFNSQGYNLIGNPEDSSGWVSTDKLNEDPKLGPLQDNGGPTKTHALLEGSPAIDHIPRGINGCGTTLTTDQRGVQRPQGEMCDIGAFELGGPP